MVIKRGKEREKEKEKKRKKRHWLVFRDRGNARDDRKKRWEKKKTCIARRQTLMQSGNVGALAVQWGHLYLVQQEMQI